MSDAITLQNTSIARLIRSKREELDLSQRELAKRMDIPASSLNRIENGDLKISASTIEKFCEAVGMNLKLVDDQEEQKRDVFEVVNYVLQECLKKLDGDYDVSNMKLNKLLYFIQKEYYLKTKGKLMFSNDFRAWDHGPVHLSVYHRFSNKGSSPIDEIKPYIGGLTEIEQSTIDEVINQEFKSSAYELRKKSHEELTWISARKKGNNELIDFSLLNK